MQRYNPGNQVLASFREALETIPRRPWSKLRTAHPTTPGTIVKNESLGQRFFRTRPQDALPLTITHERIYILPSSRGWMFVASLLVMLVASINYSLSLGYALCFLLTGLFASALLATYRNLAGITLVSIKASEATAGGTLVWQLGWQANAPGINSKRKSHQSRAGIKLRTGNAITDIELNADETNTFSHRVPATSRGWLELGRITLSSDYPLGLWRTWCYLHVPEHALIFPQPEPNGPPLPAGRLNEGQRSESELSRDTQTAPSGEFAGLRPYRHGDSLNTIAWKAAARGQGLQSMDFNGLTTASPVSLDWHATAAAGDTEARLSRLAHWIKLVSNSGKPWRLSMPEKTLPLDSGAAHTALAKQTLALHEQPDRPTTSRSTGK